MKRRKFNERQQQARLTTRILTNSRVFRHARALVIYKELFRGADSYTVRFGKSALRVRGRHGPERQAYGYPISQPSRARSFPHPLDAPVEYLAIRHGPTRVVILFFPRIVPFLGCLQFLREICRLHLLHANQHF